MAKKNNFLDKNKSLFWAKINAFLEAKMDTQKSAEIPRKIDRNWVKFYEKATKTNQNLPKNQQKSRENPKK